MWSVLGSGQTPEAPTAPDQNPAHALAHLRETHEARLHAQQPDEVLCGMYRVGDLIRAGATGPVHYGSALAAAWARGA